MSEPMTAEKARDVMAKVAAQPKKILFGLDDVIEDSLLGLFTWAPYSVGGKKCFGQGHIFYWSEPGLGKTDLANSLACAIQATFSRIQGANDLFPKDVVGGPFFDLEIRKFIDLKGPMFGHIVLIDEINRITPKTKAALLEGMEERAVTIAKNTYRLMSIDGSDKTFFWMLATANPIESEGTYVMSEAELDRFYIRRRLNYPSREDEMKIRAENIADKVIEPVTDILTIIDIAEFIHLNVHMSTKIDGYIADLFNATRPSRTNLKLVKEVVKAGISPRNNYQLRAVSKVRAFSQHRDMVLPDDVRYSARLVLPHKIFLSNKAQSMKKTEDDIIDEVLKAVPYAV